MKFFICAFVVCALSIDANAQASLVPLRLSSPILYSATYGPGIAIDNSQSVVVQAPSANPAVTHLFRAPLFLPYGLNADGTFITRTPGYDHISSLPGHFIIASSEIIKDEIKESDSLGVPSGAIHRPVIRGALPFSYAPYFVQAPLLLPTEATYVAKNRGVEHIAPLPGHINSAASLNLEPAPGSQ